MQTYLVGGTVRDARPGVVKERELSGCEPHRRQVVQPAVEHRSTHGRHAIGTWWRPAHVSALGHARVGDLGDRAFGARGRDRSPGPVMAAAVDECVFAVRQVAAQRPAGEQKPAGARPDRGAPRRGRSPRWPWMSAPTAPSLPPRRNRSGSGGEAVGRRGRRSRAQPGLSAAARRGRQRLLDRAHPNREGQPSM